LLDAGKNPYEESQRPEPNSVESQCPDIFEFLDYREFLQKWFLWKKRVNPKYSGALFARKAGLNAHTFFGMVVRGQRNLTYSSLHAFIKALGLKGRRGKYFEKLVYYNQAKSPEEKELYFNELVQISRRGENSELKSLTNYNSYLSSWHIVAMRELINFADFKPDPQWIVAKFKGELTKRQVEHSWQTLVDLDLIHFDQNLKRYVNTEKAIEIDPRVSDFSLINYHRQMLKKAQVSLEKDKKSDREMSSLTIAVSHSQMEELKKRINQFRKEINQQLSGGEDEPELVIAINSQLLVLTENKSTEEK